MSLKRKFLAQNLLLALGLLLAAAGALWRLGALRRQVAVTLYAYNAQKSAETVTVHIARAQGLLADPAANRQPILENLRQAIAGLDDFVNGDKEYANDPEAAAAYAALDQVAARARARLTAVVGAMEAQSAHAPPAPGSVAGSSAPAALVADVDNALWDLWSMLHGCQAYLRGRQEQASARLDATTLLVAALCAAALLSALVVTASQYRSIMAPLQRLRQGVRSLARGEFDRPVVPGGSREFAELADDFNRMSSELAGFYRELEEKVRATSRELVRSERLASVGFLAAGVAHEINNPLNVISGYAELTLKRLRALDGDPNADDAAKSLRIIRDEAFRCKETTEKLLTLARGGNEAREAVSLADVAKEVAQMLRGLKNYRDRTIRLDFDEADALKVVANGNEMKQVLLNLTINALQAVPPVTGDVVVEGRRDDGWVEVSVVDNGRGISPEALKHVFEPFFTDKRGAGEPGTGLGLSITHAIVESHGGRITADSAGAGRGSRFTFRLPAAGGPGAMRQPLGAPPQEVPA
jgi:signal transduction histidine kinase